MLVLIENVVPENTIDTFRKEWESAKWETGLLSAGSQAAKVKQNLQLNESDILAKTTRHAILKSLAKNEIFLSAAIPKTIYPPKFNCYKNGGHYGTHIDNAIMRLPTTNEVFRTDLSATVFLSDPNSYEGGELVIETDFGAQEVKLPAGEMVLYPSSSLHQVNPVTEGVRLAAFFWVESIVADSHDRSMLYDLDQSIQVLKQNSEDDITQQEVDRLSGIYHNLVRKWASV